MSSNIKTVGVVGTGVIGSSWTALFLSHGRKVFVADPADGAEDKLRSYLSDIWPVLSKSQDATLENLTFIGSEFSPEQLKTVDFIQENGPERLDLKKSLLSSLDAGAGPQVPICSSSSGLVPSSFISDCKKAPERVLVGHPWNPPHIMPLVELVPHANTSSETISKARDFYTAIGKKPIVLNKEVPGFVGNRLQAAITKEACSLVANGICEPEDVEVAMTQALGPRWALTGPFMTNIFAAGGNPEGYTRNAERLGPAFESWIEDMDERAKVERDTTRMRHLAEQVEGGLGQVETKELERQRDELMMKFLKERAAMDRLENYAMKHS